jgi:hypothetical protein
MARLFADENFPLPAVESLRTLGHIVMTIHEAGKGDRSTPDSEVLAFATSQGMAVLTMNRRHFIRLHSEIQNHAGIIACTFDCDFDAQAKRIHAIIELESPLDRKLVRVNRPHP